MKGNKQNNNSKPRGKAKPKRKPQRVNSQRGGGDFDNSRGRSGRSPVDDSGDKFNKEVSIKSSDNDISWYAHNPEMLKAATGYGFSYLAGSKLPFAGFRQNVAHNTFVPGVMAMYWVPTYGGNDTEVLQKAADQIYNFVVHANSRNTKYDASDLLVTVLATIDCFSMMSSIIRAYGIMNKFSDRNAYTPRALITAMGFDYDDLQKNLANMWFDINHMIAELGQLWLPKDMSIVARRFWMNANVYQDAGSPKAQYYLYVQQTYMMYQEIQFDNGTSLSPAYYTTKNGSNELKIGYGQTYTWEQWKGTYSNMVHALVRAQDRGTMLGDILKAYGRESLYSIAEVPSNFQIEYSYNPEVLTQIENLNVNPNMARLMGLKQNDMGTLEPYYYATQAADYGDAGATPPNQQVLNFHQVETPTGEQVMVATRMKCGPSTSKKVPCVDNRVYIPNYATPKPQVAKSYHLIIPKSCGTEVCTTISIFSRYEDVNTHEIKLGREFLQTNLASGTTLGNPSGVIQWFQWCAFDWAPWIYNNTIDNTVTGIPGEDGDGNLPINTECAFGDWDNYTILEANDLYKLHVAAVYSEFGIPMF